MRALAAALLLALSSPAFCQTEPEPRGPVTAQPKTIEASNFVGTEHPAIFDESKIQGYDRLEGSVSVEDKGAKVTWAPLLMSGTYSLLSETRLQLSQKESITTVGLGLRQNPFSPRSRRGGQLWVSEMSSLGIYPQDRVIQLKVLQDGLTKAATELRPKLAELRKKSAEATNPEDKAKLESQMDDLRDEYLELVGRVEAARAATAKAVAAWEKTAAKLHLNYRKALLDYRWPVPGIAFNTSLFPVLGSSRIDANNNGADDNEHLTKKREIAGTLDWLLQGSCTTPSRTATVAGDGSTADKDGRKADTAAPEEESCGPDLQISGLVSRSWERKDSDGLTEMVPNFGFSLTVGLGFSIQSPEQYEQSDDFKKSLFKPAIVLGASFEFNECQPGTGKESFCKDGLKSKRVWTPFIDLKIKKEAQFRVGVTFTQKKTFDAKRETGIGVVTLVALQMGSPK